MKYAISNQTEWDMILNTKIFLDGKGLIHIFHMASYMVDVLDSKHLVFYLFFPSKVFMLVHAYIYIYIYVVYSYITQIPACIEPLSLPPTYMAQSHESLIDTTNNSSSSFTSTASAPSSTFNEVTSSPVMKFLKRQRLPALRACNWSPSNAGQDTSLE